MVAELRMPVCDSCGMQINSQGTWLVEADWPWEDGSGHSLVKDFCSLVCQSVYETMRRTAAVADDGAYRVRGG